MKQYISILVLSITLLYSCGKLSRGEKIVQNISAKDIKVKVLNKQYGYKVGDSAVIMSGKQGSIWKLVSKSGPVFSNKEGCADTFTDSIAMEVIGNTQLKVSKNLNNSDNWLFSKSGLDTECRAVITEADIVPK